MKTLPWLLTVLLAGCSLAPDYQRPAMTPAAQYQEHSGDWAPFQPVVLAPQWWRAGSDPLT